jgi:hypothetical protein
MYINNRRKISIIDVEFTYGEITTFNNMNVMPELETKLFTNGSIASIDDFTKLLHIYHGGAGLNGTMGNIVVKWMDTLATEQRLHHVTHIRVLYEGMLEDIPDLN